MALRNDDINTDTVFTPGFEDGSENNDNSEDSAMIGNSAIVTCTHYIMLLPAIPLGAIVLRAQIGIVQRSEGWE